MNAIILTVKSVQTAAGEAPLEIEFVSEGKHYQKNGYDYIVYRETELSGLAGHKTSLKIKADSVTMRRYGALPITLNFAVGKRQTADYPTPYGAIKIEYLTEALSCQLAADGGHICIDYALTMNDAQRAKHRLEINYKPALANCPISGG